ncbi:hypothetical protein RJ639_015470 [Escallonia herrerae]|uniref:Cyanobacterial aminoacyl-tRNA synthetase CAAD domain-containing protein n=1 Tax=Escallonia herrerae TaxID=1293975 RepID=A0AA88VB14_9ASTE|nr:hypothetical protein RJ639_015470 [Escallonia herrerae]
MATAYAAATSAAATAVLLPRLPNTTTRCSALPLLPPRLPSTSAFFTSFKHLSESRRSSVFQIKASEETSVDATELFDDLKGKWDAVENKSTVILYGGGAIVAIWVSSIVVGAINSVPLLPKIMELVGLGYTGWFVYRYLLFKVTFNSYVQLVLSLSK